MSGISIRKMTMRIMAVAIVILLFIPCAPKRELKQLLQIPTSGNTHFTTNQFSQHCEHTSITPSQNAQQKSNIKQFSKPTIFSLTNSPATADVLHSYALIGNRTLPPPNSIYILHQQFLI